MAFSELLWKLLPYAIIWIIWKHKNEGIFRDKEINLRGGMANEVKGVLWYWCGSWPGRKDYRFKDLLIRWEDLIRRE
ncbi:hypothetical protein FRX31_016266 [Thalictrum thalictroides]|uniref:Uncharacterized protein n=1 Tax=Thalictrum thalictroides TaxID=46969 RepID=A0A7J6WB10_THATH|nr:hypothetical protein FRX31_016266 [Thalictrum thalictroides]